MEGDTLINGKRIGHDETFKKSGIWRFLYPQADVSIENTPWFGGKTKVVISAVHHKGVRHIDEPIYLEVGQKIRVGLPIFGGVVVKRVGPKKS